MYKRVASGRFPVSSDQRSYGLDLVEKGSPDYKDCMMKQGRKQPQTKAKGQAKQTQ